MRNFTLDGRLASAAKFVRQGARFADIGTDHAYLPIFLIRSGRIDFAFASDINKGPLRSAIDNARDAGVYSKMEFALADGLDALMDKGITDIAICGMGGELIAEIVERADFIRDESVRLILQPMSKFAHLRRVLARLGYEIEVEEYSSSQGKYYITLLARYTGEKREIDDFEAEFGNERLLCSLSEHQREFISKRAAALKRAADGLKKGAVSSPVEERLCAYANEILGRENI